MRWTSCDEPSRAQCSVTSVLVELGLRDDPAERWRLWASGKAGPSCGCLAPARRRRGRRSARSRRARRSLWLRAVVRRAGEEAVDVALFGDLDHRADRRGEQLGVVAHLGAFAGRRVEDAVDAADRLVVGLAAGADQVEQMLDLGVVGDDVAVVVEVDEVVRVEAVVPVDALVGRRRCAARR